MNKIKILMINVIFISNLSIASSIRVPSQHIFKTSTDTELSVVERGTINSGIYYEDINKNKYILDSQNNQLNKITEAPSRNLSINLNINKIDNVLDNDIDLNLCGHEYQKNYNLLIIAIEYNNVKLQNSNIDIKNKFFSTSNSIASYYDEATYDKINIQKAIQGNVDGFLKFSLNKDHPSQRNTGDGFQAKINLLKEDLKEIWLKINNENTFDFSAFDINGNNFLETNELAIHFVIAGDEEAYSTNIDTSIWAHQSGIYTMLSDGFEMAYYSINGEQFNRPSDNINNELFTIGVVAHEIGHLLFCLPDLYESNEHIHVSGNVGFLDLMGMGSWLSEYGSNDTSGSSPSHFSAWILDSMNLFKIEDLDELDNSDELVYIDYNTPSVSKIYHLDEDSYLLFEGRGKNGFDSAFFQKGLVVTHVTKYPYRTEINLYDKLEEVWEYYDVSPMGNINLLDINNNVNLINGADNFLFYRFEMLDLNKQDPDPIDIIIEEPDENIPDEDIENEPIDTNRESGGSGSLYFILLPFCMLIGYRKKIL